MGRHERRSEIVKFKHEVRAGLVTHLVDVMSRWINIRSCCEQGDTGAAISDIGSLFALLVRISSLTRTKSVRICLSCQTA